MNKKKIGIIGLIGLVAALGIYFILSRPKEGMEVSIIEVEKTNIIKTVDISGSIYANDIQEINISPGIKIEEVYFEKDEFVKAGDILAVFDTSDLNLKLRKAEIALSQIDTDIKNPGSKIPGIDNEILSNNVSKANEAYKKSEKDLMLANEKLEDLKILLENRGISEVEYEDQLSLIADLEINLETTNLNIKDAKLRQSDYGSQISDTRNSLKKQRQAALLDIEEIKNDINNNVVKAEISGIIIDFELKKDRETRTNEFVKIQDPNSFKFKGMLPQEDAVLIEKDQKVSINVSGLSESYEGLVSSKAKTASVDQSSGSSTPKLEITIDILKEDDFLVSGFDADGIIETGLVENTLALKNEAIKKDEEGNFFVYLVDSENKAKKTIVKTGLSDGYKTQILSGVKLGDRVVSNPPAELEDGLDLKIE